MALVLKLLIVVSVVSCVCCQQCYPNEQSTCIPAAQNAAYRPGKTTVSASSTCGNPPSRYCRVNPKNSCYTCNASSRLPLFNHDEKYMNDPVNGELTWWQSETWWEWYRTNQNDPLQVNVSLSFNKSFDITGEIRVVFDSPRPSAMILEKSINKGKSWLPLQYYADDCQGRFGMTSRSTALRMDENYSAVCTQEYSASKPQQNGVVLFDFSKRYTKENFWDRNVQDYLWATDIRIRMLYPGATGLELNPTESYLNQFYYAISDIQIASRCKCNGHAKWCDYPNERGKNCDCYHNTAGDDCERCKPLYNNKPWKAATSKSQPNPCEKCECHNHTGICEYNKTLDHGVCHDCQHNTMGYFCEQCKDKFYRNASATLYNPDTCLSCACFPDGITNNGSCNVTTGQCECRPNVTGRQCDQCEDTFWGYQLQPVGHCRECLCTPSGTINGSLSCNQNNGQCQCKPNIHLRQCNTCKDGFFDFPSEIGTSTDCKQCDCDYGGSVQEICEKVNGTCVCQSNIIGKRCTEVSQGFFVGFLSLLKYEAEYAVGSGIQTSYMDGFESIFTGRGYSKLSSHQWITFNVKIPVSFLFHVVLRYTVLHSSNGSIQVHVMAERTENCSAVNTTHTLTPLTKGSGLAWRIQTAMDICRDQEYTFNVTYFSENSNSTVEVDSLVLLPLVRQVRAYEIAQRQPNNLGYTASVMEECSTNYTTVMRGQSSLEVCKNISFSVMAEVFNGAFACECNSIGSVNGSTCNPYGGQCQCKPGVTGRTCDQCKPGYFGFSHEGCKPCSCSDKGSEHLVCNMITGQCACKAGVITRTCSRCNDSFYGFSTGKGCVECHCNASGSVHMQCDDQSGKCLCKNSTAGDKCNICKQNFFNFTSSGCQTCSCDEGGSVSLQCDLDTGVCSCKNNTVGMKCSSCVSGTYNIDVNNPDGCAPCYCYGRSNTCSSARNFVRSNFTSFVRPNGAMWHFGKTPNNDSLFDFKYDNGLQTKYNAGNGNVTIVFTAPDDPAFKDMLLSYGQQLLLDIEHKTYQDIHWTIELEPAVGSKVYFDVIPKPSQAVTTYSVRLHEDFASEPISAYQLQSKLADVHRLRVTVKATGQGEFWFKSMSLETARLSNDALDTVGHVENCSCPTNYTGLSCEQCNSGYRRIDPGRRVPSNKFVGCVLCSCTGRSRECNPESGTCRNCRLGSEGNHCERCQPNVDNTTDCTQCYLGFYGLGMPNFNGCEDCDCVLGNTPYGNGSVCNMTTGQCTCKPKIAGRRCDRCHENAINTSLGCVDCPECYRLLQSEVHLLRTEISTLQTTMSRLKNGHIGDLTFAQQLNKSIDQVRLLVSKADNSSGVERGLYEQLMQMNQTLNDLEEALKDTMETGMNELESDTNAIHTHANRTKEVISLVNRAISQSYNILNSSAKSGLTEAEQLASFLSGKVPVIEIMANQSSSHAQEQNRSAEIIVSRVLTSDRLVKESLKVSVDAAQSHNKTLIMIEELRKNASTVNSFGLQLRNFVGQLHDNATLILNQTSEFLKIARALNPDNSNAVTQLLSVAKAASDNATLLITRTEAFAKHYANVTAEITRCTMTVKEMVRTVNKTEVSSEETLRKATSAHKLATAAIALADKTHGDAKEMLKILKEFVNQSRQAQELAQQALTGISEANQTSMDAIARAQEVQSTIQRAVEYASQSLSMAKQAEALSSNEHKNASAIHTHAKDLEGRATSTKYKENYFHHIQQNVTAKQSSSRHLTDSCTSNYSRNAQDARSSAAEARSKSLQSDKSAKASREAVNKLLKDISALQMVNTTRLKKLQGEITRLRTAFTSLDVQHLNTQLKTAKNEQARYIVEYRQKVQETRTQTQELKQLYESLQSISCNGNRGDPL